MLKETCYKAVQNQPTSSVAEHTLPLTSSFALKAVMAFNVEDKRVINY